MNTKRFLFGILIYAATLQTQAQVRNEIQIPNLDDYQTLKCDFHMHSVFSDGLVWPTVRVDEAYCEGLDAISLTEHIEYRPHKKDVQAHHGRSYEIAEKAAANKNILLVRGSEITRSMPPGHFNAIFLNDCNTLEQKEWRDAFKAAKSQNPFIFWNHPGWDSQQPDTTLWWKEHTEIYNNGWMQGIEVANGKGYYPEAQRWCMEKGLTMIGTSDIHQPIQTDIDFAKGEHRTMTLVFAKERSIAGIREALKNRRTAVYFNEKVIGEEKYLKEIFQKAVEIVDTKRTDKSVKVTLKNHSDLSFILTKTAHSADIQYFRTYTIKPQSTHTITVKLPTEIKSGEINFEVCNLLVEPGKGLPYSYKF